MLVQRISKRVYKNLRSDRMQTLYDDSVTKCEEKPSLPSPHPLPRKAGARKKIFTSLGLRSRSAAEKCFRCEESAMTGSSRATLD